jgi:hypothetical protein
MAPILVEAIAKQIPATPKNFVDVSIIVPCFNETDKLAACSGKTGRAQNEQKSQEKSALPIAQKRMGGLYAR